MHCMVLMEFMNLEVHIADRNLVFYKILTSAEPWEMYLEQTNYWFQA